MENNLYEYMKLQGENFHWKKVTNEEILFRLQEDFNEALRVDEQITEKDALCKIIEEMREYLDYLMLYIDMIKE